MTGTVIKNLSNQLRSYFKKEELSDRVIQIIEIPDVNEKLNRFVSFVDIVYIRICRMYAYHLSFSHFIVLILKL